MKFEKPPFKNHYHDFADGCLGVSENASPFQKTGPMAETIILGTVAIRRPDETLRWNADALAFDGDPAATALLRRYRLRDIFAGHADDGIRPKLRPGFGQ